MNVAEFRKLHGGASKIKSSMRGGNTKKSVLTMNLQDEFLASEDSFKLDTPLHISTANRDYYIRSGLRKGITYQVNYSTDEQLTDKKTMRSGQVHNSFFKLVNTFGLNHNAKKLYKLLGSYDVFISGQANLTTQRWNHTSKKSNCEICISIENEKDLIFQGSIVNTVFVQGVCFRIYEISEKSPFNFVVSKLIDNDQNIASEIKLCSTINDALNGFGSSIHKAFLSCI